MKHRPILALVMTAALLVAALAVPLGRIAGTEGESSSLPRVHDDLSEAAVDLFTTAGACVSCHTQMTDVDGTDVSIDAWWASTMMANAAIDPYWQASVRFESQVNPHLKSVIEDKCATCHTPMAHFAAMQGGEETVLFDGGWLNPAHELHALAVDGVSCTLCHQIGPHTPGEPESFSGEYVIDPELPAGERPAYSRFEVDDAGRQVMQAASGYVPLVGEHAVAAWNQFAGSGFSELVVHLEPYLRDIARWIVGEARALGLLFVQGFLIVILSALLYAGGEGWGRWMLAFGCRLAGRRGEQIIVLAGQAIRGVALGVIVTAILQSALGGLGLVIAGVPFAGALTAVMFLLCVAQLGAILVLAGSTAWLFATGSTGWGTFLLVWAMVVGLMDNFVRPVLIKRGADLPLLLIFAGVIGGMLSFGLVGIFVGPVVLAVTYTLVDAWVQEGPAEPG